MATICRTAKDEGWGVRDGGTERGKVLNGLEKAPGPRTLRRGLSSSVVGTDLHDPTKETGDGTQQDGARDEDGDVPVEDVGRVLPEGAAGKRRWP